MQSCPQHILGLGWNTIRKRIALKLGEKGTTMLEQAWAYLKVFIDKGWDGVVEMVKELGEMLRKDPRPMVTAKSMGLKAWEWIKAREKTARSEDLEEAKKKVAELARACGQEIDIKGGYAGAVGKDEKMVEEVLTRPSALHEAVLHLDNFERNVLAVDLLSKDRDEIRTLLAQVNNARSELQKKLEDLLKEELSPEDYRKIQGEVEAPIRALDIDELIRRRDRYMRSAGYGPDTTMTEEKAQEHGKSFAGVAQDVTMSKEFKGVMDWKRGTGGWNFKDKVDYRGKRDSLAVME